ncbi:MAG: hypothetical protein U0L09_00850 [Christensenellales bacterium]|nr:hypothetical protein [Christensenellales bacterium]
MEIPYRCICEDNFFYNDEGKAVATVYTYSYFRKDVQNASERPVMFAFNGGPGSGSLWLHLGLLGPLRVKLVDELKPRTNPPYELEDNPNCLLDICDLVIMDMVGTGLARLFDESAKEAFFKTHTDVRHLAMCIADWLNRYQRHNSKVFLAGESYGTARSVLLASELLGAGPEDQDLLGISVSGIMLLGSYFMKPTLFPAAALDLPSMAATHWYHSEGSKPTLREFVDECYRFIAEEYLPAYSWGDELPQERKQALIRSLHRFTGLKESYLARNWMGLNTQDFRDRLLEDENRVVSFYDSRYAWDRLQGIEDVNPIADDAAMGLYTPLYQGGFALLRQRLNIQLDRRSKGLSLSINGTWDREAKCDLGHALAACMRRNPGLRVFFATGLYDLCTTAGNARFLARHNQLDPDRVMIGEYPSGHMAYLGEESARLLAEDLRRLVELSCEEEPC